MERYPRRKLGTASKTGGIGKEADRFFKFPTEKNNTEYRITVRKNGSSQFKSGSLVYS